MNPEQFPGVYLHIPFCERKCTYCNFNTTDFAGGLAERYVEALTQEIAYWGKRDRRPTVDTLYFGGGTPSLLEAGQLARLIAACEEAFVLHQETEITIEINPATLSRQKIEGWLRAGVNRASVGVQSFINTELVSLSRTHDAEAARRTLAALGEAGFTNLSLDLIAGLPGQRLEDWRANLQEALHLRPEHLSLYLLEVKEGTQLFAQLKRGQKPLPDDDLAAEMYEMICQATVEAGYEQYEISNFALRPHGRKKTLRSQHNMKYWTGAPFYGLGCGAHSYDGRERRVNVLQTEAYIEAVAECGQAVGERRQLSEEERAAEAIFMGLRLTEGILLAEFRVEYGVDILGRYGRELQRLAEAELVEVTKERLRLTAKGRLLSNEVFLTFV